MVADVFEKKTVRRTLVKGRERKVELVIESLCSMQEQKTRQRLRELLTFILPYSSTNREKERKERE